ncbi:MAG: DUF5522 domain-containing protein [Acidobacteria bacterium]|nr:DUF5522 domain-containing protein [Acidobacteriota bacterium]
MSESHHPKSNQAPARDTDAPDRQNTVLLEGVDFYLENGLMVFTAAFLHRRGYCCERGCRHCPYEYSDNQNQDR